ncbi:uncharacterized protein LOC135200363 [Macrobrachium nipponense]|uniref:uncharacterized protein LOC135200363 n=1 Tax=Macrobrachium nipponense TaxID=159736 RepID=UPI0030C89FD5
MNSLIKRALLMLLQFGLLTEGLNLKDALPVPWRDRRACQVDDEYFEEDSSLLTLCDPDGALPPAHRMITSEMLRHCKENSADNTTFLLLLVNAINHADTNIKNETAEIDHLTENGVNTYNLTREESAVFLVVEKEPFGVNSWYSDSLSSTFFPSLDLEELLTNLTESFRTDSNFPFAVNRLVYFFCEKLHAPPYRPAKWDALTLLWMILVIIVIALVTGTVIHLIMVRYKAFHKGDAPGEQLRQHRGRPSLGPLSMEMEDFGTTPFQPSRNLLLSTDDVTVVSSQQQQTSSTANLLES